MSLQIPLWHFKSPKNFVTPEQQACRHKHAFDVIVLRPDANCFSIRFFRNVLPTVLFNVAQCLTLFNWLRNIASAFAQRGLCRIDFSLQFDSVLATFVSTFSNVLAAIEIELYVEIVLE